MDEITSKQANKAIAGIQKRTGVPAPYWNCPRCRRFVNKIDAHSIFDFKVKICNYCAMQEKAMPDHNWIKEVLVPLGEYVKGVQI